MFEKEIEYIKEILHIKGYKFTQQRRNIILIFLENPQKHFSPTELHVRIKNRGQLISLATVYRNINLFSDNNIIEVINYGEEKLCELKMFGKKSIHVHISCINCNSINNFVNHRTSLKVIQAMDYLEKDFSFVIKKAEIFIKGICDKCSKGGEFHSETKKV